MSRRDQPKSGQFPPTAGGVINTEPRNNGLVVIYRQGLDCRVLNVEKNDICKT